MSDLAERAAYAITHSEPLYVTAVEFKAIRRASMTPPTWLGPGGLGHFDGLPIVIDSEAATHQSSQAVAGSATPTGDDDD